MNPSEPVPLVDLQAIHQSMRSDLDEAIASVLDHGRFIGGPEVAEFEQAFARFCGTRHAIGVASGTAALHLILLAAGVKPGDQIATTPHTFFATAEAISVVGATPRFVEVDETFGLMDPAALAEVIDEVAAVLPVHLYGLPADMERLREVAGDTPVIEDAAQAHGATISIDGDSVPAGGVGLAAAFSFFPGKNLGCLGDGGAITTNDEQLAERVRRLRDHGRTSKYIHDEVGFGYRLDTLQAAVLSAKLPRLAQDNKRRREAATFYSQELAGLGDLRLPEEPSGRESAWHLYVIRSERRDALLAHLADQNIGAAVHYPVPLHLQPAYQGLGYSRGDLPVAERWADECLSLPLSQAITVTQQTRVVEAVRSFFGG